MYLTNTFYVVKIKDKYYCSCSIFLYDLRGPFHTLEEAHLFLIEEAAKSSTDKEKTECVEIEKAYLFIRSDRVSLE